MRFYAPLYLTIGLALAGICPSKLAAAAPKVHVISFGKWTSVQYPPESGDGKPLTIRIRALIVDGRVKEYVIGNPHEVTERLFVVRRAFRINDSLADETVPHWQWQRGGWVMVDRATGHISAVNLSEYDPLYSTASWYRDYIAYCGVSDDGKKIFAIVAQLSRRKPILKKALPTAALGENSGPDSACSAPEWQRNPVRVSFEREGNAKETYAIRGHVADVVDDREEDETEGSR